MNRAWASALLLPLALAACGDDEPPAAEVETWALTEEVTIGGAADSAGALSRIAGILPLEDGGIWILETSERDVRVHGPDGNLVQRVGGPGDGPGQFTL